jgi:hypothetical protein
LLIILILRIIILLGINMSNEPADPFVAELVAKVAARKQRIQSALQAAIERAHKLNN